MRKRKTEIAAKELVGKFRETDDLIEFIERCMQSAAWYGKFSGRNRFMFQAAIKRELGKIEGGKDVYLRENF
jgi:hypothetical protein